VGGFAGNGLVSTRGAAELHAPPLLFSAFVAPGNQCYQSRGKSRSLVTPVSGVARQQAK